MSVGRNTVIPLREPPARDIAAAVLVAEDGRYLMQLRDDRPAHLPEHWTCFGGGLDPDETPEAALRRELEEELCWRPREADPLVTSVHSVEATSRLWRVHFFTVPFRLAELRQMRQMEGADMAVMRLEEICGLARIAPWDLCAVMIHARRVTLFTPGPGAA